MTVRRVVAGDLAGLDWLDDGTVTGLATAAAAGTDRALVLGAVAADGPRGVLAVDLPPWRERVHPWLWLLDVHPDHRGRGTGTSLLVDAHRRLAKDGHRVVELGVADTNPRAAALYRRLGYVAVGAGTDPGPAGPEAWTRMRLSLRPCGVS